MVVLYLGKLKNASTAVLGIVLAKIYSTIELKNGFQIISKDKKYHDKQDRT